MKFFIHKVYDYANKHINNICQRKSKEIINRGLCDYELEYIKTEYTDHFINTYLKSIVYGDYYLAVGKLENNPTSLDVYFIFEKSKSDVYAVTIFTKDDATQPENHKLMNVVKEIIIKDFNRSFDYAKDVIKGRWEELENFIESKKDDEKGLSRFIYRYSTQIMKKRWVKAEHLLKFDSTSYKVKYCSKFSVDLLNEEERNKLICETALCEISNTKKKIVKEYFSKSEKDNKNIVELIQKLIKTEVISEDDTVKTMLEKINVT